MALIIDTDSHFLPRDAFEDEECRRRFRGRWPRFVFDAVGHDRVVFPERLRSLSPHQRSLPCALSPGKHQPAYYDSQARVEWLDKAGIDMQVLVPSPSPFGYNLELEIGLAVCQSYNNAISRVLKRHPGRFIGLAVVPMQDPVAAVDELDRAILELGIHAPLIITNVNGRNLDDEEFWPFYQRVEELGVALIVHGNRFEGKGVLGMERLAHMHLDNSLGFLYEGTLAITSLIMGGVLDMYPRLRVGVLETGAGYLTYLMDRLQEVYVGEVYGGISPRSGKPVKDLIKKPPEEYASNFWICFNIAVERRSVAHVVERFGGDRFLVNTDFPHGLGGASERMSDIVGRLDRLTSEQKDQLLGQNACALFGIEPATRKQIRGI